MIGTADHEFRAMVLYCYWRKMVETLNDKIEKIVRGRRGKEVISE